MEQFSFLSLFCMILAPICLFLSRNFVTCFLSRRHDRRPCMETGSVRRLKRTTWIRRPWLSTYMRIRMMICTLRLWSTKVRLWIFSLAEISRGKKGNSIRRGFSSRSRKELLQLIGICLHRPISEQYCMKMWHVNRTYNDFSIGASIILLISSSQSKITAWLWSVISWTKLSLV